MSEAKKAAFAQAAQRAAKTGKAHVVWLVGPDRWTVTEFEQGDKKREGYYAYVLADGTTVFAD